MSEIFAVVFSNYEPAETDSLWWSEEQAEARAAELNNEPDGWGWHVVRMEVLGERPVVIY